MLADATLKFIQVSNAEFQDFDFLHSTVEKSTFQATVFTDCTFSGDVFRNVTFDNCTFENCKFDNATSHNCTYRNVDPETAAQLEAIGFTEDTTERIFDL